MNEKQLHYFIAVSEYGSMTKAAEHLYITQPALSRAIADLEETYNRKLFHRHRHGLELTLEGRTLLEYASSILSSIKASKVAVASGKSQDNVTLAVTLTIGHLLLADIINNIEASLNYSVVAHVKNTRAIEEDLLAKRVDLAIIEGRIHHPQIRTLDIISDELALYVNRSHPLANEENLSLDSLQHQSFILREPGSGTRESFENIMYQGNITWLEKMTASSLDAIINLTANTEAIGILPKRVVSALDSSHGLIELAIKELAMTRNFSIAYTMDHNPSSDIINAIKETMLRII